MFVLRFFEELYDLRESFLHGARQRFDFSSDQAKVCVLLANEAKDECVEKRLCNIKRILMLEKQCLHAVV